MGESEMIGMIYFALDILICEMSTPGGMSSHDHASEMSDGVSMRGGEVRVYSLL